MKSQSGAVVLLVLAAGFLMASRFIPYKNDFGRAYKNSYLYGYGFEEYHCCPESLVHIRIIDDEIIGIRNGMRASLIDLDLTESVKWYGTMGYVGVVLTSDRLLGLTIHSGIWKELPLRLGETIQQDVRMSTRLALVVSSKRIMVLDSWSGDWKITPFPIFDEFEQDAVNRNVAVVLTSRRAIGYALGKSFFSEIGIPGTEDVVSLSTSAKDITIQTNRRLLIFTAADSSWSTVNLNREE